MTKKTHTTYFCDNTPRCSEEEDSGHGLPVGWITLTYIPQSGIQVFRQYCSIECLEFHADFLRDEATE